MEFSPQKRTSGKFNCYIFILKFFVLINIQFSRAYGVLLWEIMSFGYMPYTGCSNREVMSMVTTGGRLEKPVGCPDPVYGMMMGCWHPHPDNRPNFVRIVERIGYCLQVCMSCDW